MSTMLTRPDVDLEAPPAPANTVLSDLADAIRDYPSTYLTIDIYDVNPPGSTLNAREEATFRVRVRNSGPLAVDDLELKYVGLHGTEVRGNGAIATFTSEFVARVGFDHVPANQRPGEWTENGSPTPYAFKVTGARDETDLLEVSVANWTSNLDNLFEGNTIADRGTKAVYRSEVLPQ